MIHLNKDEKIESVIRKHWFVLFRELFVLTVVLIIPFVLYHYFTKFSSPFLGDEPISFSVDSSLFIFLSSAWFLLIWMKFFSIWTDYYLDVWTVTDKRIIDVDQRGFFRRQTSTFRMERIQDITVEINGVLETLLNFGDIHVQTAGEGQEFIMKGISRPRSVREIILRHHDVVVDSERNDPKDAVTDAS